MSSLLLDNTLYEPEQFPGLIYRMQPPEPKVVILLFQSGKFVCTGAKSEEKVQNAAGDLLAFEKVDYTYE